MAKSKSVFVCSQCGYETSKWLGRCPDCGQWNTLAEETPRAVVEEKKLKRAPGNGAEALPISQIPDEATARMSSGIGEMDRVLGGGVVEGSVLLVGGDPGIGKSTLLTQLSANISARGGTVLYVSGEESARQIKLRANRLGAGALGFYVLAENDVSIIEDRIQTVNPSIVIIDSIQTMYLAEISSAPGSVSQVRECAQRLTRLAKLTGCAVFLVGHVTKEGSIAGPRVLEHMVDAVIYFEGDRNSQYRLLRAQKNRFGSVNELGMFEMTDTGMREVSNVSETLLSERAHDASGCVVMCAMEGTRPLLTDVQALAAPTVFGNPRRMAAGIDVNRLFLLLAVLEKRAALTVYNQDVYINIAGGMTLTEPAADLAVCAAIASSVRNLQLGADWAVMGEVGLAGELRAVSYIDRRLMECQRLGFQNVIMPKANVRGLKTPIGMNLIAAETLFDALKYMGVYDARNT